mgnify:CR=1 FL=1
MPHISYSELKDWVKCPFYHKLIHLDGHKAFTGNEYTAFGTAIHSVCERVIVEKKVHNKHNVDEVKYFQRFFEEELAKLDNQGSLNTKLIDQMREQGIKLAPLAVKTLGEYFKEYELISVEERLFVPISEFEGDYDFKGFIDVVIKTPDGKYHIIDWKTCSWGWDARKKNDKMINYQLTLYKNYFCQKHNIDPENVETYFALLKRTAKKNHVEFVRVTSGNIKMKNAVNLVTKALYNITQKNYMKNKLACNKCEFYGSQSNHCPRG